MNDNEWISVEDRLPDEELRKLRAYDPDMTVKCLTARQSIFSDQLYVYQAFYDDGRFVNENAVDITDSVTHWCLLPSPPTKGA